ncbi:hypothetical protein EBS_0483 [endosymbiont of unidentified scaly snail isolate Monju]|nr:hypothetical protein EBS_0483 [endosymbiont of unidentified scaly snail isolate Monju]
MPSCRPVSPPRPPVMWNATCRCPRPPGRRRDCPPGLLRQPLLCLRQLFHPPARAQGDGTHQPHQRRQDQSHRTGAPPEQPLPGRQPHQVTRSGHLPLGQAQWYRHTGHRVP